MKYKFLKRQIQTFTGTCSQKQNGPVLCQAMCINYDHFPMLLIRINFSCGHSIILYHATNWLVQNCSWPRTNHFRKTRWQCMHTVFTFNHFYWTHDLEVTNTLSQSYCPKQQSIKCLPPSASKKVSSSKRKMTFLLVYFVF